MYKNGKSKMVNLHGQAPSFICHQLTAKPVLFMFPLTFPVPAEHMDCFKANFICKCIILKDKHSFKKHNFYCNKLIIVYYHCISC